MSSINNLMTEQLQAAQSFFDQQNYKYCVKILIQLTIDFCFSPQIYYFMALCYYYLGDQQLTQRILKQAVDMKKQSTDTDQQIWKLIYELLIVSLFTSIDYQQLPVVVQELLRLDQFNAIGNIADYELSMLNLDISLKKINFFDKLLSNNNSSPYYYYLLLQKARIKQWLNDPEYTELYRKIYLNSKDYMLQSLIRTSLMLKGQPYQNQTFQLLLAMRERLENIPKDFEINAKNFKQIVSQQKWYVRACCMQDPYNHLQVFNRVELDILLTQLLDHFNYVYSVDVKDSQTKISLLITQMNSVQDPQLVLLKPFVQKVFYNIAVFNRDTNLALSSYYLAGGNEQLTEVNLENINALILYLKLSNNYKKMVELFYNTILITQFKKPYHDYILLHLLDVGEASGVDHFELLTFIVKKSSADDLAKRLTPRLIYWFYYLSNKVDKDTVGLVERMISEQHDNTSVQLLKCLIHAGKVVSLYQQTLSLEIKGTQLSSLNQQTYSSSGSIQKLYQQSLRQYVTDGLKKIETFLTLNNQPREMTVNVLICLLQFMVAQPAMFSAEQLANMRQMYDNFYAFLPAKLQLWFDVMLGICFQQKSDGKLALKFLDKARSNSANQSDESKVQVLLLLGQCLLQTESQTKQFHEAIPLILEQIAPFAKYNIVKHTIRLLMSQVRNYLLRRIDDLQTYKFLNEQKKSDVKDDNKDEKKYRKLIECLKDNLQFVADVQQDTQVEKDESWLQYSSGVMNKVMPASISQIYVSRCSFMGYLLNIGITPTSYSAKAADDIKSIQDVIGKFEALLAH